MAIYARKGDRVVTRDGRYLGSVAFDLDSKKRLPFDGFDDLQIDIHKPSERLPLTAWCLDRMKALEALS
jgi:hypothetical protein